MKKVINYQSELAVNVECLNITSYPLHYHDDLQLLFVLDGELELNIIYTKYFLIPGSLHIIHSGDVHSLKSLTENNAVLVINFNEKYFRKILPHFKDTVFITRLSSNSNTNIQTLYDKIFSIICEDHIKDTGYISKINNTAVSLLNYLTKNYRGFLIEEYNHTFVNQNSTDYMQTDRISRIVTYIYENYQDRITLTDIADRESVNQQYLSRLFHNIVGLPFRDFLSMVRVENSLWRILSTDNSISKISMETGFSDSKYFVAQFHKYMGLHPKEYKKKYKDHTITAEEPVTKAIEYDSYIKYMSFFTDKVLPEAAFVTNIKFDFSMDSPHSSIKPANTDSVFFNMINTFERIPDLSLNVLSCTGTEKDESIAEIYKNTSPQMQLIHFIENSLNPNAKPAYNDKIVIFDSPSYPNSLFLRNGLRKPLYHFLEFTYRLDNSEIFKGESYAFFRSDDRISILLLNRDSINDMEYNIGLKNINRSFKQSSYLFSSRNTCMEYLAQLNFKPQLEKNEIDEINKMTYPRVSYKMVPELETYNTGIVLGPLDIMLVCIDLK